MEVEQKSYAQILIVTPDDFISKSYYKFYERACPFSCFPGMSAKDFRCILKDPDSVELDKDLILLLKEYWDLLPPNEQKAVLDHELGHIVNGDLERVAEDIKNGIRYQLPNEDVEKAADAYSVELNGNKAMHSCLLKAADIIAGSLRKYGDDITGQEFIDKSGILKRRLKTLKEG